MILKQSLIDKLISLVDQYDRIILHRHINPDPDAIGSQLGLKAIIQTKFPDKTVLAAGKIGKGLEWLGQMDTVEKQDYEDALVIVLDTPIFERIDGNDKILNNPLIKIDHHLIVEHFADLEIVEIASSSTAELITKILMQAGSKLPLSPEAATYLYAGVAGDTGRFLHSNTTQATFEAVAYLMQHQADNTWINRKMNEFSLNELNFQSFAIAQIELFEAGVAAMTLKQADLIQRKISVEDTNAVTNIPGRLKEVLTWVIFIEKEDSYGEYRARIRSKGPNIHQVAIQFKGGGHEMASGANVYDEEEKNDLIDQMIQVNKEYLKNQVNP
ncbi:DHH family phosphoesterase [Facklamia miroungae]|uniref:Phosphoesterase RecJ domain-containing protein n=1 Tax=Facklamia miroungae TaxID=120956 RepID=A0A1G7R367_9LACT|nr:bifunctional oligoribonuclease/PAP phosphatase NrnA [Facklamia miroungae]NKZ29167.1 bifunctional oligoribonuclease/PAP phosphatase NrnA [Facklamia miroungae]SDG05203.1 phosphoesterase RecJ domain-containing protein [Facklamia miroungae]